MPRDRALPRRRPARPAAFPSDPERRRAVEEAELWGDDVLQMPARRLTFAATLRGPEPVRNEGEDGRLGVLLFKHRWVRTRAAPQIGRRVFEVDESAERELLEALPGLLDRVDAWIEEGVLNAEQLNAADYMIVTSLALLMYRPDLEPEIAARPAGGLVDRVLPEPVHVP